jgi:hypothetical protein
VYHKIPNLQLAIFGVRHSIHLFFPSLYSVDKGPKLSTKERTTFYEKGLRPAIANISPWDHQDWPTTFEDENFRARKRSGAMAYQTKMVSAALVPHLVPEIRQELELNGVDWGHDIFVLHTIRGTKSASRHSKSQDAAEVTLARYMQSVDIDLDTIRSRGKWWIDVGLEFSSEDGYCLQWKTTSHFHVMKEVLRITNANASRITTLGSTKYSRDVVSHLPAISGCRIEPGSNAKGPFEVEYAQVYPTEKALTFGPEGGFHGKAIMMKEAMGNTQPVPFLDSLYGLFGRAMNEISSKARIEVRVPIGHATTVFQGINDAVFLNAFAAFTRHELWYVILLAMLPSTNLL